MRFFFQIVIIFGSLILFHDFSSHAHLCVCNLWFMTCYSTLAWFVLPADISFFQWLEVVVTTCCSGGLSRISGSFFSHLCLWLHCTLCVMFEPNFTCNSQAFSKWDQSSCYFEKAGQRLHLLLSLKDFRLLHDCFYCIVLLYMLIWLWFNRKMHAVIAYRIYFALFRLTLLPPLLT